MCETHCLLVVPKAAKKDVEKRVSAQASNSEKRRSQLNFALLFRSTIKAGVRCMRGNEENAFGVKYLLSEISFHKMVNFFLIKFRTAAALNKKKEILHFLALVKVNIYNKGFY